MTPKVHAYCMMMQQIGPSILAAPLAAIDRRALSQAWYSALHVAQSAGRHAASDLAATSAGARRLDATRIGQHLPPNIVKAQKETVQSAPRNASRVTNGAGNAERRAPRSRLARDIERTFLDPRAAVKQATFSLRTPNGRVHVLLQTCGDRVALIALCAPPQRDLVSRALEQARYALASRNIDVRLEVRGNNACS